MSEQETNWVILVDEEGNEHRFNLLNIVEVSDSKYAIMLPEEQSEAIEEDEAVIFRIDTDNEGEEILVDIEDDEEFERVCNYLDELEGEDFEGVEEVEEEINVEDKEKE